MKHLMKTGLMSLVVLLLTTWNSTAQETMTIQTMNNDSMMVTLKDSTMSCKKSKHIFPVRADFRIYNNTLQNTRTLLASSGFVLDKEAIEIGIKFGYFPKIYYFQQLGTLTQEDKFTSVLGIGLKDRLGYDIFKQKSHFVLMPYVEVGAGYYRMNLYRGVKDESIQNVLKGGINHDALDAFTATIDLGLNLGFWFKLADRKVSLVVNGGFLANTNDQWRLGGALAFKEKLSLASPYVGLNFGVSMLPCQ